MLCGKTGPQNYAVPFDYGCHPDRLNKEILEELVEALGGFFEGAKQDLTEALVRLAIAKVALNHIKTESATLVDAVGLADAALSIIDSPIEPKETPNV